MAKFENGVVYNVYKNGVRIDDVNYDGSTIGTTGNPKCSYVTQPGAGQTTIQLDETKVPTVANDVIVIRKITSDGFIPDPDGYDTLSQGGDLAYATARGLAAEEIVVDGDSFVTPGKVPKNLFQDRCLIL